MNYLSVLTSGEIRKGIANLKDDNYKEKIRLWLDQELTEWFKDRILPIDQHVANKWGILQAQSTRTFSAINSLIAATALHFDLIIITRNTKDFNISTLEVLNPFLHI